jgi:DNA-binding transcriptional ArsR family regulator
MSDGFYFQRVGAVMIRLEPLQYSKIEILRFTLDQSFRICDYLNIPVAEFCQFRAEFFKALAHPLRIKILDTLRSGEIGVNDLCARLGVEQSTISQQLSVLRTRDIVAARKSGNSVFYSVKDPEIFRLLDVAKEIFNNHLIDIKNLLAQLEPAQLEPAQTAEVEKIEA